MNTINSVYYGWAFLIVCGGGSYYFAKRSINADRAQRQQLERERQMERNRQLAGATQQSGRQHQQQQQPQQQQSPQRQKQSGGGTVSEEIAKRRAGEQKGGGGGEASGQGKENKNKSKYEASVPYRSPKGDRFSGL